MAIATRFRILAFSAMMLAAASLVAQDIDVKTSPTNAVLSAATWHIDPKNELSYLRFDANGTYVLGAGEGAGDVARGAWAAAGDQVTLGIPSVIDKTYDSPLWPSLRSAVFGTSKTPLKFALDRTHPSFDSAVFLKGNGVAIASALPSPLGGPYLLDGISVEKIDAKIAAPTATDLRSHPSASSAKVNLAVAALYADQVSVSDPGSVDHLSAGAVVHVDAVSSTNSGAKAAPWYRVVVTHEDEATWFEYAWVSAIDLKLLTLCAYTLDYRTNLAASLAKEGFSVEEK